jgi:DNA-binding transcriptional LysR family regulator
MDNPFDGMAMFTRIVEAGSFSRAAAELGVAKSSLSEAVRRLEGRLSVRLLDRTTRRVVPTEAGQAYYARAQKALEEARGAVADVTALQAPVGILRVASPEVFTRMHIAPFLPEFIEACPGLQIEFVEDVAEVDLLDARVHLAIRIAMRATDTLVVRRLGTSRVVVVASPAYLERFGVPGSPAEVAEHRTIGFSPMFWGHEWRFRRAGAAANVAVRPVVLTNAAETLRGAALHGVGLTALPDWMVTRELANGQLVQVLADWDTAESGIYAVYRSNRMITAKVKLFSDFLARRIREQEAANWSA